ncbi:MAG: hypothetical protein AUG49_21730 [Catenulispora sp. 13_1_20CM_3_70_7]|jgi:hypothetical protein|nr:hypothetical protein [Catenulisporales bacterium]OLE21558.1 MAG: hypothetical protein AUG49_21730 [Catenulispora sp. 13_1_20CM_3_70_7]
MIIGVIVAILLIAAVAAIAVVEYQKRRMRASFGPEYDEIVRRQGGTRAADHELSRRRQAYAELDLRALSDDERADYAEEWQHVQGAFVDDPRAAVADADALVRRLARSRGYPDTGEEDLLSLLSVAHRTTITGYREATGVRQAMERDPQGASTEDLRQALQRYGAFFEDMLAASGAADDAPPTRDRDSRRALSLEERR